MFLCIHPSCPEGCDYYRWQASHAQSAACFNLCYCPHPRICSLQLGNTAAKAETWAKRLMWSEMFLGMFLWGVIYQMHAGASIRALHPNFLFWFGFSISICQVWGRSWMQSKCCSCDSWGVRYDFLSVESFVWTLGGRRRKFYLQRLLSGLCGLTPTGPCSVCFKTATFLDLSLCPCAHIILYVMYCMLL